MSTWAYQINRELSLNLTIDPNYSDEESIFKTLKSHPNCNEKTLLNTCAKIFDQTYVDPTIFYPLKNSLKLDINKCKQNRILPLYTENNTVGLALDNPFNDYLKQIKTSFPIQDHYYCTENELNNYLKSSKSQSLELIIESAVKTKSSDIHFSETPTHYNVSIRQHGQCMKRPEFKIDTKRQFKNQIKFMAGLDISKDTIPQDGQLQWKLNKDIYHIRVSTLPTTHGEDIVLRLFNQNQHSHHIDHIGLNDTVLSDIKEELKKTHGLFLITGATGSGKTSTLYAIMTYIYSHFKRQIISIEDPVEVQLNGIRQSSINTAIGFNFNTALKAILRQDPDVIVIGEIRDKESAQTALAAAYTGHLVLASLHTNSVENTVKRLQSFDCDPFLLSQCLLGICSQQLHPISCPNCRDMGCKNCNFSGITGRQLAIEYLGKKGSLSITNQPMSTIKKSHLYFKDNTFI